MQFNTKDICENTKGVKNALQQTVFAVSVCIFLLLPLFFVYTVFSLIEHFNNIEQAMATTTTTKKNKEKAES